ncbi:RNA-dependent ATPase rok1 [Lambiella insularis]|nr:RNA-dependent ATPase rok1 [Lambiella insularis]
MDILKLLSRSTNLQKSLPSKKTSSNHHLPSAGATVHSQIFTDGELIQAEFLGTLSTDGPLSGIKRKREPSDQQQSSPQLSQVNFFEEHGQPSKESLSRLPVVFVTEPKGCDRDETARQTLKLTEEEIRKIFKSHRLRVMLLNSQNKPVVGDKKPKRVGLSTGDHKRTSISPVYSQPMQSFSELRRNYRISRRLAANIDAQGYTTPTEVQMAGLPLLLGSRDWIGLPKTLKDSKNGKPEVDLLTIAPTGSGKTLAFLIPLLQGLLQKHGEMNRRQTVGVQGSHVRALVIAPTHELVNQIVNEGKKLANGTGLKVSGMRKGMHLCWGMHEEDRTPEIDSISVRDRGGGINENLVKADVLVTTPLLLLHALSPSPDMNPRALPSVRYLVLDEADVLLDPLFRSQTLAIWDSCTNRSLQTSLWSATIGSSIESLAQTVILERRRALGLSASNHYLLRLIVGLKDSALPTISHRLIYAGTEQGKLLAIRQLLHPSTTNDSSTFQPLRPPFLVFTQTISRAVALHSELLYDIAPEAGGSTRIAVLHSDLSETARSNTMTDFRKGEIWIIITTDLLSRGIDFSGVNGVVNYDIPNTGAAYIHRAGRTGRAGREGGTAVTLYTKEDIPYIKNIANVITASQKVGAKSAEVDGGIQGWLLDALPKVSKKTKQDLKTKGVQSRRPPKDDGDGRREARKARISTKSGFDRMLENRKKGAVEGSKRRAIPEKAPQASSSSDEEWNGFEK